MRSGLPSIFMVLITMMLGAMVYGCASSVTLDVASPTPTVVLTSDSFNRPALGSTSDAKLGGQSMWWATDFGSPGNPSQFLFAIDPSGRYAMASNPTASVMWISNKTGVGVGYSNCAMQVTIHQQPTNNTNSAAFLVFRGNLGSGTQNNIPHVIMWGAQGSAQGAYYTLFTALAVNNPNSGTIVPQLVPHYILWIDDQGITPMPDDVISAQFYGTNLTLQITRANGTVVIQHNVSDSEYLHDTSHGLVAFSQTPLFSNFILENCY